ncbi:MAG: phage tail sheath subtilisin-like domain-containing protein [Anaerolineae bacterium]
MPDSEEMDHPDVSTQGVESSAHPIGPVPSSTTAFVGRALRGPVNMPTVINSFGEFRRLFGGLWKESRLGYAVADFFLNGGSRAVIVRLFNPGAASTAQPPSNAQLVLLDAAGLEAITLEAKDPGAWGSALRVRVTYPQARGNRFALAIHDPASGITEEFTDLTIEDISARRVDRVLAEASGLVRLKGIWSNALQRPTEHGEVPAGTDTWDDENAGQAFTQANGGSDGEPLTEAEFVPTGAGARQEGLGALDGAEPFSLMVIPPYKPKQGVPDMDVDAGVHASALACCIEHRAMYLVDPPWEWHTVADVQLPIPGLQRHENAAVYFPWIKRPDALSGGAIIEVTPSGAVAGVMARTDQARGIWKAPAGMDAGLRGVHSLSIDLTDAEAGELNGLGINSLRTLPTVGHVIWGARTMMGHHQVASEWKYVPVRRLALFIEESLHRGTEWTVFEPNDETLWTTLRLNVGAFMHQLYRQGAFQGQSPRDAYFVRCDGSTTSPADIERGIVNLMVGFAPLRPAEFVILRLQLPAGQRAHV